MPIYANKTKYGFMISEPKKYFATFISINVGMALIYAFSTNEREWYLILLSAILHVLTIGFMIALALIDPGIIPKITSKYEQP